MTAPLVLTDVHLAFRKKRVLEGVSLALEPGTTTVLLGPNGAGKSTLLHLAMGLLPVRAGEVRTLGAEPTRGSGAFRTRVGFVPDRPDAPAWMTVRELMRFLEPHYPEWDREHEVRLCEELEVPLQTRFRDLSKGQAARAMLVGALAFRPQLLLLDEPFSGLDPLAREAVLRAVLGEASDPDLTVLLTTHELDLTCRLADRIVFLQGGEIRRDGAPEVFLGEEEEPARGPAQLKKVFAELAQPARPETCEQSMQPVHSSEARR